MRIWGGFLFRKAGSRFDSGEGNDNKYIMYEDKYHSFRDGANRLHDRLIAFTIVSTADYEMSFEDSAVKEEMIRGFELAQAADSLGLTGQDWIDYVNMED